MDLIRYEPITRLLAARAPKAGATTVLAVDGPSGAGKTWFSEGLGAATSAPVLHVEDLYRGWDSLAATPDLLVADVLRPLRDGTPATYHRWDWDAHRVSGAVTVTPTPVLIVEGVGSGSRVCAPFVSVLIWMDDLPARRKQRALDRDGGVYAPFWEQWAAQERALWASERTRERADVVVSRDARGGILVQTPGDRGEAHGQHEATEQHREGQR